MDDPEIRHIKYLGLDAYARPRSCNKWLLPICAMQKKESLMRLNPKNPGNWEEADIDGVPTVCYRMTGAQIRDLDRRSFVHAWTRFANYIGEGPAKGFFYDMWVQYNNKRATARNLWEMSHGGIRGGHFNRGMSVRASETMSII